MPERPHRRSRDEVVYAIDASLSARLTLTAPAEVVVKTRDAREFNRCASFV